MQEEDGHVGEVVVLDADRRLHAPVHDGEGERDGEEQAAGHRRESASLRACRSSFYLLSLYTKHTAIRLGSTPTVVTHNGSAT